VVAEMYSSEVKDAALEEVEPLRDRSWFAEGSEDVDDDLLNRERRLGIDEEPRSIMQVAKFEIPEKGGERYGIQNKLGK
jgi:hypothetical protein